MIINFILLLPSAACLFWLVSHIVIGRANRCFGLLIAFFLSAGVNCFLVMSSLRGWSDYVPAALERVVAFAWFALMIALGWRYCRIIRGGDKMPLGRSELVKFGKGEPAHTYTILVHQLVCSAVIYCLILVIAEFGYTIANRIFIIVPASILLALILFSFGYFSLFSDNVLVSRGAMHYAFRFHDVPSERTQANFDESLDIRFKKQFIGEKMYLEHSVTLNRVAAELHTNSTYLSRYINYEWKMTFSQLVNTLRIEYAKQYYELHPDALQSEVADLCGFSGTAVFNSTFKRLTGTTPKIWVKGGKEMTYL